MIYNENSKKLKNFLNKLSIKNTNHIKSISSINRLTKINQLDLIINTTSIGFENWFTQNGYYNLQNYSPLYKVNFKKKIDLKF